MVYGEASPRADMAANTPSEFIQSDNGLRVHKISGVVELPGGISAASANVPKDQILEVLLDTRALGRNQVETYMNEVGDIGSCSFKDHQARLLNILLADRDNGPMTMRRFAESGFLPSGNPGGLDGSVQLDILVRQTITWINSSFAKPLVEVAYTPDNSRLHKIGLAPYVRFEDAAQTQTRANGTGAELERAADRPARLEPAPIHPNPKMDELVETILQDSMQDLPPSEPTPDDDALAAKAEEIAAKDAHLQPMHLTPEVIDKLRQMALTPLEEVARVETAEQTEGAEQVDEIMLKQVKEHIPKHRIDLPDDSSSWQALEAVLTNRKLPLTHRQREVLALANSVDPDVFGGVMLSNGKSYVEALRIQSSNPNISTANLLGVSELEFETILKDTLATVRSISAQAAELLEQTIYLSR